jgi:hypothetical protein
MSAPTAPVIGVDERLELGCLAVIGDIDPLAGFFVLLRPAPKGEPFHMNERARYLQPVAAAGVDADATILVLDSNAWRGIGGPLALVPKAVTYRRDGFRHRDQTLQFLGFDEERHLRACAYSAASLARGAGFRAQ